MSIERIFATDVRGCVAKILLHVTHHVALPMQPQQRHVCIQMALQLNLIIFNRQVYYSA